MTGKVSYKNPCEDCGSSDALVIYEDHTNCYSCGKQRWEEGMKPKEEDECFEDYSGELQRIGKYATRGWRERRLSAKLMDLYGVRSEVDTKGEPVKFFSPRTDSSGEVVGYRVRSREGKSFYNVGANPKRLFGQELFPAGGKRVIITEGYEDMLAIQQCNLDKYGKLYPVLSLDSASSAKAYALENRDYLRSFQEVILWGDNDEPGRAAMKDVASVVGYDKAKTIEITEKDAGEFREKHSDKEVLNRIWDATPISPAGIVHGESTWEEYKASKEMTFTPWPPFLSKLNEMTHGRAMGSITMFAAGCHSPETQVLMADGSVTNVGSLEKGDRLCGPDGEPRIVCDTFSGVQTMYGVTTENKDYFEVNESHILSLKFTLREKKYSDLEYGSVINMTVKDYLALNKTKRKWLKQYFGPGHKGIESSLPIDPWLLGVWLGDGTERCSLITNQDKEVWASLHTICSREGWVIQDTTKGMEKRINGGLQSTLRANNLLHNKHIPEEYLRSGRPQRLALLAGLLDTDGHLVRGKAFEICQSRLEMAQGIQRLAKGLGFRCSLRKKWSKQWRKFYYLCWISGNTWQIPTVVERKKAQDSVSVRNPEHVGFSIKKLKVREFAGFELSGDHLYQLANGVVTHNTSVGKTSLLLEDFHHLLQTTDSKIGGCFLENSVAETVTSLMAIHLNKRLGLPGVEVEEEEERSAWEATLGLKRAMLLDHQGSVADSSLIDKIEYLALSGCKYIYLDHITIAVSESEGNVNQAIDSFMSSLLKIVKKHNCWIGVVSHLRKTSTDAESTFETGAPITEDSLKGSGSLKQISFQTIGISRNKLHKDEEKRNTSQVWLLKDRKTGQTGMAGSYSYNTETGRLFSPEAEKNEEFDYKL